MISWSAIGNRGRLAGLMRAADVFLNRLEGEEQFQEVDAVANPWPPEPRSLLSVTSVARASG